MPGELEAVVREMYALFDRMDVAGAMRTVAEDAQGVDEISRRWLRGRAEVDGYMRQLAGAVTGVRSELRDVRETVWGDMGAVTCWLEQDYTMEGPPQHVSAPTSVVLRRLGGSGEAGSGLGQGGWRIVLFHSIPLPEQPAH